MIVTTHRRSTGDEIVAEMDRRGNVIENLEAQITAIRKVRDGYAGQAKFADVDAASYFREFVRRIDAALG